MPKKPPACKGCGRPNCGGERMVVGCKALKKTKKSNFNCGNCDKKACSRTGCGCDGCGSGCGRPGCDCTGCDRRNTRTKSCVVRRKKKVNVYGKQPSSNVLVNDLKHSVTNRFVNDYMSYNHLDTMKYVLD